LAKRQHGVVTRAQLIERGFNGDAIKHRMAKGRLHAVRRGVYAVGRPELTQEGSFMAAVLACGSAAALSHSSAAALWAIRPVRRGLIEVSIAKDTGLRPTRVNLHRRPAMSPDDVTTRRGIPVTTPVCTLTDLAACLRRHELEAAINEADRLGLTDPERLRQALQGVKRPGAAKLRAMLDGRTLRLTRSELERWFLPIARRAGLPEPLTNVRVNGYEVDFYWPELGLVVETDGLRYHRTPQQQARDRLRDQAHTAAGLTQLRFTHDQIRHDPAHVERTLRAVARR
jgi:very-short-patch-repair endonuclease